MEEGEEVPLQKMSTTWSHGQIHSLPPQAAVEQLSAELLPDAAEVEVEIWAEFEQAVPPTSMDRHPEHQAAPAFPL